MLSYKKYLFDELGVTVDATIFESENGTHETHWILSVNGKGSFERQLSNITTAFNKMTNKTDFNDFSPILKRYFLSDISNQYEMVVSAESKQCALSVVQQPLLNGSKIALWVYLSKDVENILLEPSTCGFERNGYTHLWSGQLHHRGQSVEHQTQKIFSTYNSFLNSHDCTLKDNCIRTWLYVQNVDVNYAGVVEERKAFFTENGLTEETHYISSTGIEGRFHHHQYMIHADAYSLKGVVEEQIQFLEALDHLNPTHEYGVTFERGTAVAYGDRKHIFISGTASIDSKGDVVHQGDILNQTKRTFTNIKALLQNADACINDIMQMIVYIRDIADYGTVFALIEKYYQHIPKVYVNAPVCRPGWLIEIECIAVKACTNEKFNKF